MVNDCVTGDVSYLTEDDIEFLGQFGTPEKPISVAEFLDFWNSLSREEKLLGFNDRYWKI